MFPRTTRAAGALAIAALVVSASPLAAQDPSFTPEQIAELEAKTVKLQEFLANQDTYLPTVNLIDAAQLPVTFPYSEIQDHVVVDVAFGDDAALPFMFDTGAGTLISARSRRRTRPSSSSRPSAWRVAARSSSPRRGATHR